MLVALALILRRPDAIFRAQFFEDDASWFSSAYETGPFHALLETKAGYLSLAPRLAAALGLLVPFGAVPLLFNSLALFLQTSAATFLLSNRLSAAAPLSARAILCFFYVALPNTSEVHACITNAQWHLAALAAAILVATAPVSWWGRILDCLTLICSALSGPFSILLFPLALAFWVVRRASWTLVQAGIFAIGATVQLSALAQTKSLGAASQHLWPELAVRTIGGQLFLFGSANGGQILPDAGLHSRGALLLAALLLVLGTAGTVYAFVKSGAEVRLFIIFAGLVLASSARRLAADPNWDWPSLMQPSFASRYWFIPRLGVITVVVSMLGRDRSAWLRACAGAVALLLAVSCLRQWRYDPFPDLNFPLYATLFDSAPPGDLITIPVCPPGWKMVLTKH